MVAWYSDELLTSKQALCRFLARNDPALDEFLGLERCPSELVAVRSQTKCLMAEPEKSINANSISGRRNGSGAPLLAKCQSRRNCRSS